MDNIKKAININELDRIEFSASQLRIIKKYRLKTIIGLYASLAVIVFMLTYFIIMLTDNFKLTDKIIIGIIVILMIICIFVIIKSIISIHCSLYQKAQYGIIEKKFTQTRKQNKRKKVFYYFNISFPEKNVFIENVSCSKDFYLKSTEGDKVLVISFYKNDLRAIEVVR